MRLIAGLPIALLCLAPVALGVPEQANDVCQPADRSLAQGLYEVARGQYEDCLKKGPVRFEALSNLGIVYSQLSEFDLAIQAYSQALALSPQNAPVHMNLGLTYLKKGRSAEAAVEFERSLLDGPDNPKTEELLAFCHYQTKEYALAALEAERAHQAQPDEASAAFLLGSAYLKMGLFKDAIPLLYSAAQKTNTAETRMVLGEGFLGVQAYREALKQFEQSLALAPQTAGLYADLGTAYAGLSETEKALEAYQKELARDPNSFQANYYLGRLKRLSGDVEQSKKLLAKAEQLRPADPSIDYEYAVFALRDRDYAKAEALLKGILQKLPSYTDAHVLLAEVYFKMRRTEEGNRQKAIVEALRKAEQEQVDAEGKVMGAQSSSAAPAAPHR